MTHGPSSSVDRVRHTTRGSRGSRCGALPSSSPSWTRRGCGSRRSRASRSRRSGSQASASTTPSWPSPRSPASSRRGCASTRPVSRSCGGRSLRMALAADPSRSLRRAALAHDLGRVGVSNAIWEKPGPLGFGEWERVRLHPHFSERAFAQSHGARTDRAAGRLAPRAPRRLGLPPRHTRAGARPGCPHPRCLRLLRGHARGTTVPAGAEPGGRAGGAGTRGRRGRLDGDAVDAVLAAAGHRPRPRPRAPLRPHRT